MSFHRAFTLRLRPGALTEYRRLHAQVWPELEAEIRRQGVRSIRIFERDPLLVVVSESVSEDSWDAIWSSEIHRRWDGLMEPLIEYGADGRISAEEMTEVYSL